MRKFNYYLMAILLYFFSAENMANQIHEILISTKRFEGVSIYVWTTVGEEKNGICLYKKETDKIKWTIYKESYLYLNGDKLKKRVGFGYTCAKTNVEKIDNGHIVTSSFKLLLDSINEQYIGSNPFSSSLRIDN